MGIAMFRTLRKVEQKPPKLEDLISFENIATDALVDRVCYVQYSIGAKLTDIAILLDSLT